MINNIRITNLTKNYDKEPIFENANLFLPQNSFTFLTGRSGSGKSTLLKMIHRLELPDKGEITLGSFTNKTPLKELRKNIGFIFQDYKLLENQTVQENIKIPLSIRGIFGSKERKMIAKIATECGVNNFLQQKVCNLSGGEKQLIALVRAAIIKPILILADEPTANLDRESAEKVLYLFKKMHQEGSTILIATHDLSLIQSIRAKVFLIQNRKINKVQEI